MHAQRMPLMSLPYQGNETHIHTDRESYGKRIRQHAPQRMPLMSVPDEKREILQRATVSVAEGIEKLLRPLPGLTTYLPSLTCSSTYLPPTHALTRAT